MAPELLNPSGFGLNSRKPTKRSDIYAFGMTTYQVSTGCLRKRQQTAQGSVQVITRKQPFPGAKDGVIIYSVVAGVRPARPQESNELVSDNVWNFISRCWSSSWNGRPDANLAINALNDAADAVEIRRKESYATATDQGERSHRGTGVSRILNTGEQGLTIVINRRSPAES